MAFVTTTLSAACGTTDRDIQVASATTLEAGRKVIIDQELMEIVSSYVAGNTRAGVLRGLDGTKQEAHASGANVTHGLGSDFPSPSAGTVASYQPAGKAVQLTSYSAAGAIALPTPGALITIAILNGTGALAMTLANPTKDMDGALLIVVANGKAAHTLAPTAGLGNGGASFDVGTFSAAIAGGCILIACNGFWCCVGNGILGATAATGAPLWA